MSVKHPRKPAGKPAAPRRSDVWVYAALALVVIAIYGGVSTHDFVNYDDPVYVTENAHVRDGFTREGIAWAFTSAHDSNWIPLTWLSHMLDCQMFGLQAGMQHLVSVAIHLISSLLLFGFLKRITGARWPSAFVAFVFGAHPLHVESVAWIAERKDVLCGLFSMLTLWSYARFVEKRSAMRYALVAAALACALLAKPMAVTLPLALLLLDSWPFRRLSWSAVTEKIPLAGLSAAATIIAVVAQRQAGTVAELGVVPLPARIENAFLSYVLYLWNLIVPVNLSVIYPYAIPIAWWEWPAAALVLLAITVGALRSSRPYLAMGWLWYVVTLAPVIGLIQIGVQSRADRYTYLPMIGVSIMLAWGFSENGRAGKAPAAAGLGVCAVWAGLAWVNVGYWQNSITLFQHAVEVTDGNYVAYNNLGSAFRREGRFAEAIASFETAAKIRPDGGVIRDNLGEALTASGKAGDAIAQLERAVKLNPGAAKAHVDLGGALIQAGRADEAASEYRAALKIEPDRIDAKYGLGGVLAAQGHNQEAAPLLEAAVPLLADRVRLTPDDPDAHFNLGLVYAFLGRGAEAIPEFSSAARLRPEDADAHYNLAVALFERNRFDEAFEEAATAVRLRPGDGRYLFRLALVLEKLGKPLEALERTAQALKLDPGLAGAQETFARLHLRVYGN